jgi:peptidoglycan/LPS O-acetylase OafA/YrhL
MTVSISNPVQSTYIFISIFVLACLFSCRRKKDEYLSPSLTQELKGFAILAIIFAHIGYFLSSNHSFLFPISVMAGVGVNLFFFLSGFGLTVSKLKKDESLVQFYKRKLPRLYIPFWIALVSFLALDALVLNIFYPLGFVTQSFLGVFTSADMFTGLNSPLWYFTLILAYYILFPVVFSKRWPWISAVLLYIVSYIFVKIDPASFSGVVGLYEVHLIAFPLGMLAAWFFSLPRNVAVFRKMFIKMRGVLIHPLLISLITILIGYLAIHSGVGERVQMEQSVSMLTMVLIVFLFILKKTEFRLLSLFGLYSYEIYLLHWPLMYRYDILYTHTPGWVATILYLAAFVVLGMALQKLSRIASVR